MTLLVSDFSEVDLPELPEVPGMTTEAECRYLYWLASSQLSGIGRMVEIGSWLGRSSLHLAAGLRKSSHSEELHCFDGFTWASSDPHKSAPSLRAGDNFQKYFEANLAGYEDLVTTHRTLIANLSWDGAPVEVLFLDAPKKLPEITRCLEVFGPALIPGKSIVAIQDYLYFPAYALAACMDTLRDYLELAHVVQGGSTVAFRVKNSIDFTLKQPENWDFRSWSPDQVEAAWARILDPLPAEARERLEPGLALHLYDCGAKERAIQSMSALPMTPIQKNKIARTAKSHIYFSYPTLFTAAGYPGTPKQNLLAMAKRIRDWTRQLGRTS